MYSANVTDNEYLYVNLNVVNGYLKTCEVV